MRIASFNVENLVDRARARALDVLGIVEVENRPALKSFSDIMLPATGGKAYAHAMAIDGDDNRGIDVGILVKDGYEITSMRSHVNDTDSNGIVFSRAGLTLSAAPTRRSPPGPRP